MDARTSTLHFDVSIDVQLPQDSDDTVAKMGLHKVLAAIDARYD